MMDELRSNLGESAHDAPTSIGGLSEKARLRPVVYVCSPLSGDIEGNQAAARRYCRFVVDSGGVPVAPQLLFPQFMNDNDPAERELALFMDIVLLTKCAELWVFGNTVSKGMAREIEMAESRQMPIRYFTSECEEVLS